MVADGDAELIKGYPCTSCGASLEFATGTTSMECPYCGAQNEIDIDLSEVEEHDLEELPLLAATTDRGMGVEQRHFRCERCGAHQAMEPAAIAVECVYCGSPAIVEAPSDPDLVRPVALVPFAFDDRAARGKYRQWLGAWWRRLISPGSLKSEAIVTKIRGVYVPFFTFDAQAESDWSGWRTEQSRRTSWTYHSGHHSHFYDDVLRYASVALPDKTLRKVMPFQTGQVVPYRGEFLSGFAAEEYTLDPEVLWASARDTMMLRERLACRLELDGWSQKNLHVHTVLQDPTWKHILLPLYVANYVFGERHYQFLVNGQTGEVKGSAPISWAKVGGIVAIAVAAAVGIAALLGVF